MDFIDINALSPADIEGVLPGLDGITKPLAKKLAEVARQRAEEGRAFFESEKELLDTLVELGLRPQYRESVGRILGVGPSPDGHEPIYRVDFRLDPERFVEFGAVPPVPEDTPEFPEEDPPVIFGEEISENNRPLVVVPGIMGSQLFVDNDGYKEKKWPPLGVNGIDIFRELERPIREGKLEPGIETVFDSYSNLLTNLASIGFHQNLNLLLFNYDWTQSNRKSGEQLATAIRAFLVRFNRLFGTEHETVDVICHSMGGLVTRSAITHDTAPVRRTVYIATPHYGAPAAYFTLHDGIDRVGLLTEIAFDLYNIIEGRDDYDDLDEGLNRLAALCDSVYELLPNEFYLDAVRMLEISPVLESDYFTSGPRQTYFEGEWQLPIGLHTRAQRGIDFTKGLGPTPPGEHLLILSPDVETVDEVEFEFSLVNHFDDLAASPRQGDETVPTYSACAARGNSEHVLIRKTKHLELPNVKETFETLRRYLGL